MTTGEYDKYNIEELHELIQDDQPDKLDDYAQAWANAAEVLKTEMETLEKHMVNIQAAWASGAAKTYVEKIQETFNHIETAHGASEERSKSLSKVASDVRAANEGVREAYKEWQAEKNKAPKPEGFFEEALDTVGLWNPEEDDAERAERRKPFDETARTYLNNAALKHQDNLRTVNVPATPYTPVKPVDGRIWDSSDVGNIDFSSQGASAYGADSAATAAASHAGPALQSGVSAPSGPSPAPSAPSVPSAGPGGVPVGPGVPVSRGVTPPVPGRPGSTPGSGSGRAPRTPSLPGRNGQASGSRPSGMNSRPGTNTRPGSTSRPGTNGRPGTTGRNGTAGRNASTTRNSTAGRNGTAGRNATTGRNGTAGRNASSTRNSTAGRNGTGRNGVGRGRQVSRLAPADRTGRVRASGEVLGQRKPATKPATTTGAGRNGAGRGGPVRRTVQPAVIGRAGKKNRDRDTKTGARRQRRDNTGHGYTAQVIGQRQTPTEPDYTHTPIVANTVHDAGKVFGARPQTDTLESARQHRMRNRRRNTTTSPTGITRPVIGNGITNPHQIHHTPPATPSSSVPHHQADRALWQQTTTPTPPVIGTRTPPPTHHHTPGNELKPQPTQQGHGRDHDDDGYRHDPGPTAFTTKPTPPTWPTQ